MRILKQVILPLSVMVLAIPITGCLTTSGADEPVSASPAKVFDYDGLPDSQYLVGGGYFIVYRAKEAGELFLADDHSNRLLATISLQPGEEHELIYDLNDEDLIANLEALGFDPKKAEFKLYFVPR